MVPKEGVTTAGQFGGTPNCQSMTDAEFYRHIRNRPALSTGQIARLCGVAPRSVAKWFDLGLLKGYRLPGSLDRRVPRDELIAFLKRHNMPTFNIERYGMCVTVLSGSSMFVSDVAVVLGDEWEVYYAAGPAEAGKILATEQPEYLVLDYAMGRCECDSVTRVSRAFRFSPLLVVLACEDASPEMLVNVSGAARVLQHPVSPLSLADALTELSKRVA